MKQETMVQIRVHRTFVEVAPLVLCFPRTRSWPDIHRPVVELNVEDLDCGGGVSDKQEMPKKVDLKDSVDEVEPGSSTWSEELGLHPDDPGWKTTTNLMICNLPARCTLEELSTYLRSLVPDTEMQINLPCALSGRNKGYAFVKLNEGLSLLVRALWKSSIPTRKSTRLVKLQPANVNFA